MRSYSIVSHTIKKLRKQLNDDSCMFCLTELSNGLVLKCEFKTPASERECEDFVSNTGLVLPPDFKDFLTLSNGGRLFGLPEWGGGIIIYSLIEVATAHAQLEGFLPVGVYPIGDDNGEEYLLIDTRVTNFGDRESNYLFWTSALKLSNPTMNLQSNFEIWLERLVLAQGNKFWDWNVYSATTYYQTHKLRD
jgi:hypothetical protein